MLEEVFGDRAIYRSYVSVNTENALEFAEWFKKEFSLPFDEKDSPLGRIGSLKGSSGQMDLLGIMMFEG